MAETIAETGISFADDAGNAVCGTPKRRYACEANMTDPFDLRRFVDAQAPLIDRVTAELSAGSKRTHWMWFVFPQIRGLGQSEMARRYAISSESEARAYLDHPMLGERLRVLTKIVNALEGRSIEQVFGYPDDLKFHSSMTLFAHVAPDKAPFEEALNKYFGGEADLETVKKLA
jgi:uncharacterized protein (DUF1810 family)